MCRPWIVIGDCFYCDETLIEDCKDFNVADLEDVLVCSRCWPIELRRLASLELASPPVSVIGQHQTPGQPTYLQPVAGAGGETG
jgi:hypothetical protein